MLTYSYQKFKVTKQTYFYGRALHSLLTKELSHKVIHSVFFDTTIYSCIGHFVYSLTKPLKCSNLNACRIVGQMQKLLPKHID